MSYSIHLSNKQMAEEAYHQFQQQERNSCYICSQMSVLGYHLLMKQYEQADILIENLVTGRIPKKYQQTANSCLKKDPVKLYRSVMMEAIDTGQVHYYKKYLRKYLSYYDNLEELKADNTFDIFYKMSSGCLPDLENDLKEVVDDIENFDSTRPLLNLEYSLIWYVYFKNLHQKGISQVMLAVKKEGLPVVDANGNRSTVEMSKYFENKADKIGLAFERSRAGFSYTLQKTSYEECGQLEL